MPMKKQNNFLAKLMFIFICSLVLTHTAYLLATAPRVTIKTVTNKTSRTLTFINGFNHTLFTISPGETCSIDYEVEPLNHICTHSDDMLKIPPQFVVVETAASITPVNRATIL